MTHDAAVPNAMAQGPINSRRLLQQNRHLTDTPTAKGDVCCRVSTPLILRDTVPFSL
jgi:hypothetical protein